MVTDWFNDLLVHAIHSGGDLPGGGSGINPLRFVQSGQAVDARTLTLPAPVKAGSAVIVGSWSRDANLITGWSSPGAVIMSAVGPQFVNGRPMSSGYFFAAGGEQNFTPICASADTKMGTWAIEFAGVASFNGQVSATGGAGSHLWIAGDLTLAGKGVVVTWAVSECDAGLITMTQPAGILDVSGANPDAGRPSWAGCYIVVAAAGPNNRANAQHLGNNVDAYAATSFSFNANPFP